ncbi:LPS export ABC transporter periplasmic protein LptC [Aestuariirhabdus sp. Z084]|uniref:LPS export ABC transporter periplasmic protein LptC n=1 Tax=Aestuariirhabdus haliotis TaxID=2918751 RepID=UPI00201B37B7|nr:LPS export ABC transporter periplasmic protein LptC [Aestuariirhabdus haliotis]MCL6415230.1 LPS export ABC transporter periplasmic protein LptC [Aestuariirhabdus haliotis]MCL6419490.1 LPS export ABC transporter periplasmic protein LptC [Aestuariirhabdus haliotis]
MIRAVLVTLLCGVLFAYAGLYLYENTPLRQTLAPPNIDPRERQEVDFYLDNAQVTRFNELGKPDHRLKAERVNHFPHNDTTMIREPRVILIRDMGERLISARSGKLLPGNEDLELWDDVSMTMLSREGLETGRLDTDFITLYSEQQLAETNRPVVITSPEGITHAVGMKAHLNQDRVQLQSNVRGIYEHH